MKVLGLLFWTLPRHFGANVHPDSADKFLIYPGELVDQTADIKIFIAHSQHLFRKGLSALLGSQPACRVVGDGPDFLGTTEEIQRYSPDILLFDASLIRGSRTPTDFPAHRILFLANQEQIGALSEESRAAVLRTATPGAIGEAIRRLAGFPLATSIASTATKDLRSLADSTGVFSSSPALTSRENEILLILADGHTAREVAEELSLSVKTVEAHKLNLMRKLGVHNRAALIRYALEHSMLGAAKAR